MVRCTDIDGELVGHRCNKGAHESITKLPSEDSLALLFEEGETE